MPCDDILEQHTNASCKKIEYLKKKKKERRHNIQWSYQCIYVILEICNENESKDDLSRLFPYSFWWPSDGAANSEGSFIEPLARSRGSKKKRTGFDTVAWIVISRF